MNLRCFLCVFGVAGLISGLGLASTRIENSYSRKLTDVKSKILTTEKSLIDNLKSESQASQRIKSLRSLLTLQKQERDLSLKRLAELEGFIAELEGRRETLQKKVQHERERVRQGLADLYRSMDQAQTRLSFFDSEQIEAPRRRVLSKLISMRAQEIESLKIDLADADQLASRIQEEKQQLAYVIQDQKEQASLLEFHQKLQEDVVLKKHQARITQLENYRKLKTAESELERLMGQFNARVELKRAEEAQRTAAQSMVQGEFARLKGKLKFPSLGSVVSSFGRAFDVKSSLYVFRKGIEISAGAKKPVKAVAGGKVVYAGVLPGYGQVSIIDHGAHYYSLSGRLGAFKRKVGELVSEGDEIGWTDESGQPLYFEIRARNVAVNPLQWLTN